MVARNTVLLACTLALSSINPEACAQSLPDAPLSSQRTVPPVANADATDARATGTISGTVTDSDGAFVSGAEVILTRTAVKTERTTVSLSDGSFSFEAVGAGPFRLTAIAMGLAIGEVSGNLPAGGVYLAPPIKLNVATQTTELTVSPPTEHEIAEQQIHQEEKQRVLGFFPNFYVSYVPDAAPLDAKQKFRLALHEVVDPTSFIISGAIAGVEQAMDLFPGYGSGPAAFGKRYGAALADNTSTTMFSDAIYPSLFHQDPRYYYMGTGTVLHRTKYALETALICKGDNGRWQTNYSQLLGSLSAGALANAYYAASDRNGVSLTFENSLLSIAGVGLQHIFQEFVLKDYTSHVPPGTP